MKQALSLLLNIQMWMLLWRQLWAQQVYCQRLAAVKAGKRVLLANKEALVMSGDIMMQAARDHQALLLPVDSEHNAIFQSLPHNYLQAERTGQPTAWVYLEFS